MIDKPESSVGKKLEEIKEKDISDEAKSMASETGLTEKEAQQLIDRRKQCRNVYEELKETYKKAEVLDTGEIKLANGKIIGHRQWMKEYKQHLPLFDRKERQVMQKLGIEYKKMGQIALASFDHSVVLSSKTYAKKSGKKHFDDKYKRMVINMSVRNNKILREYMRCQYMWFG